MLMPDYLIRAYINTGLDQNLLKDVVLRGFKMGFQYYDESTNVPGPITDVNNIIEAMLKSESEFNMHLIRVQNDDDSFFSLGLKRVNDEQTRVSFWDFFSPWEQDYYFAAPAVDFAVIAAAYSTCLDAIK